MELFRASRQWSERPADERFSSLDELLKVTKEYATQAATATVPYSDLRVEAKNDEVVLIGKVANANFTHWSFGQLCRRVEAPAEYLRALPATLAVQNLMHGLKNRREGLGDARLMFHKNGSLLLRAITSEKYSRIWNFEVAERLVNSKRFGWRVPPARPAFAEQPGTRVATKEDLIEDPEFGLSIREGDLIAPAGIYASDHDMFVFLVNPSIRIKDGSEQGLSRFVIVENSEVGDRALKLTKGLYEHVCGNHIIWGAKNVTSLSVRHVGDAMDKMEGKLVAEILKYSNESASDQEAVIARAKTKRLGMTKEEVLDHLFGKRVGTYKLLEAGYDAAEAHEVYGDPKTVYGMVQGITHASQNTLYGDARVEADRVAAKVMEIAF